MYSVTYKKWIMLSILNLDSPQIWFFFWSHRSGDYWNKE